MTRNVETSAAPDEHSEWPTFDLRYTFNPQDIDCPEELAPDDLVVFDPTDGTDGGGWITADRGAYVDVEDAR